MVLVLGTFDEESLGTKIHRNEAAADRRESKQVLSVNN